MRRMKRGELLLSSAIVAIASLAGCGGGGSNPDAVLVHEVDASPPDSSPPDAFVCTMDQCPGNVCTDLQTDPEHCGDCDTICQAGAECVTGGCVCPTYDFVPATLTGNPLGQDMVLNVLAPTLLALTPYIQTEIDLFAVGYDPTTTMIGIPYALDGGTVPTPPFVAAAYDVDPSAMTARAAFVAASGTLVFTRACSTGVSGTLTDVTFQAGNLLPPSIDPNGCTFTLPAITFDIGDTTTPECQPPAAN
jgi:hypothetical protein